MIKNLAGRAALTMALAAGAVAATAGAAQASSGAGSAGSVAAGTAQRSAEVILNPGEHQLFSTWFWGSTKLCVTNWGGTTGVLEVASADGADPEYVSPPAYSTECIYRWWWGVPVWGTNVGPTLLTATAS